ncbi:unnamed protein product [Sphenostylis stenocarpa]|uniref:Uncharacterized protein n=1 Tax=Sphenostylis stenocarpa TaxID=92480 RepID=A0AA87B6X1_9FABA|nr:unnamed protein product [Sphenostylis stenocarpa]
MRTPASVDDEGYEVIHQNTMLRVLAPVRQLLAELRLCMGKTTSVKAERCIE